MWVVVYTFGLVALFESLKGFQVDLRVKNLLWSGLFGGVWVFMIHFIQAMTNDLSNFQLPRDLWHTWLEELNTHTHKREWSGSRDIFSRSPTGIHGNLTRGHVNERLGSTIFDDVARSLINSVRLYVDAKSGSSLSGLSFIISDLSTS